jgi:hypothetical protein
MANAAILAVLLLAVPPLGFAEEEPEQLLSAETQVYFRWDGVQAHRSAYAKTALGKMLAGDTGKFLTSAFNQLQDLAATNLTGEQLLQGLPPEQLQQIQAAIADAPRLLTLLGKHGIVIGGEVRGLQPPAAQLLVIIPDAASEPSALFGTLRLAASLLKASVEERKIAGRSVNHIALGPVHLAWWVEGKHVVLQAGTDHPEAVIKGFGDHGSRLVENALYKKLRSFSQFETGARAFVDIAALVRLAKSRGKDESKLMGGLGLEGLKSWTFYSGFDGEAERTLSELDMQGPRTGLLRMLQSSRFKLSDLPPLPADAFSWSATNFDAAVFYDAALQAAESIVAVVSPDSLPMLKGFLEQVDAVLGINLRKDLLGALGDRLVQYSSPGEGIFFFGQLYLFKVRDGKKLEASLEQAIKAVAKVVGLSVSIKKVTYRGIVLHEVHVRQQGFLFVPTFTIHNGWFALGYFPQTVHGFVLRSTGELPSWKPDARVESALAQMPREFVSISVADPRPTIRLLLTLAPLVAGGIKSAVPDAKFEVGSIPNASEATQHLFPNVSVVSDDGNTLRSETRASLALPVDFGGLEAYAVFLPFAFAARLLGQ